MNETKTDKCILCFAGNHTGNLVVDVWCQCVDCRCSEDLTLENTKERTKTKTDKLPEKFGPVINLKPKGSMLSKSELTGTNYHVTKFYSRVRQEERGWTHIGFEATEKHILGQCKYCEIDEVEE